METKGTGSEGEVSLAGREFPPGEVTRLELPVARLPVGGWISLPVVVLQGLEPGPTLWLSGAVHGDELNGVAIIEELLNRLEPRRGPSQEASLVRGRLLAVPVVNVFGLLHGSRYLPDRRDLNRCFPGSRRGALASQLAYLFMNEIVARGDVGIDFHTGSKGRTNLPQIRTELTDPETERLARAFGASAVLDIDAKPGTLRSAVTQMGGRVLLYEGGEALRFDRRSIRVGVEGTLRVMEALGMLESGTAPPPKRAPRMLRGSSWTRARRSGFFQFTSKLGAQVEKGEPVGRIFDSTGRHAIKVKASGSGVIVGYLKECITHRGDALVHVARWRNEEGPRQPSEPSDPRPPPGFDTGPDEP